MVSNALREQYCRLPDSVNENLPRCDAKELFDPAVVIKNWGAGEARLKVDGKSTAWSKDFRAGHLARLEGTDLVIWMRKESTQPTRVEVSPAR